MIENSIRELRVYLGGLPLGKISAAHKIEDLLAKCWQSLTVFEGGMAGYKLRGRTEEVIWNPPCLTFTIERHGGTVQGSGYGELQSWEVDMEKLTASMHGPSRKRWLGGHRNKPLHVEPMATEIAKLILAGTSDQERLNWKRPDQVRVLIGNVIPGDCPKQTLVGRRTRFKRALRAALEGNGWTYSTGNNTAIRINSSFLEREPDTAGSGVQRLQPTEMIREEQR